MAEWLRAEAAGVAFQCHHCHSVPSYLIISVSIVQLQRGLKILVH